MKTKAAPYFAVETRPARPLHLVMTLHLPSSYDTAGENRVRFWNYTYPSGEDSIRQDYALSLDEPLRFGLGARWIATTAKEGGAGFELGAQVVVEQWSMYVDRHGERPLDPFSDTVSAALGGAVEIGTRRVAADIAFTPSPVPPQDGRTNYVDSSRLGADVTLETPVTVLGVSFDVGLHLEGQALLARTETKHADARHPVIDEMPDGVTDVETNQPLPGAAGLQTNNPGYPGYKSSGWLAGAGLSIALR